MKKFAVLVALIALLSVLLCGCGKFTCDGCGEEKTGKKHKVEFMGEEGVLCGDCYEEWEALGLG